MEPDDTYPNIWFLGDQSHIRQWKNRLPHWQHENHAAYFVTFRLADSLPTDLLNSWRKHRAKWLEVHPKPWTAEQESEYHRLFSMRIDQWLDAGHGVCPLADKPISDIVQQTLTARNHLDYELHSWVIMPNHVHILFSLDRHHPIHRVVGSWKRISALRINRRTATSGTLWQKDYFDRIIRDWDHLTNVARYIRHNPTKAHLPIGVCSLHEAAWIKRLLSAR